MLFGKKIEDQIALSAKSFQFIFLLLSVAHKLSYLIATMRMNTEPIAAKQPAAAIFRVKAIPMETNITHRVYRTGGEWMSNKK